MSKKIRYLILAAGAVVFCLLAPLMVLYVSGITYNFETGQFQKTGILALNVDPKNADIYLNGQVQTETGGNIKFLEPGEYDLLLRKPGYFDWSKRLEVEAGQVSWASPPNNKIFLFKQPGPPTVLAQQISDFELIGKRLLYLTPSALTITSLNNPGNSQNISLPKVANRILLSPNRQIALLTNAEPANKLPPTPMVVDLNNQSVFDLSGLFKQAVSWKFGPDNQLFALQNTNLYRVDYQNKQTALMLANVSAFSFQDNDVYYLTPKAGGLALEFLPRWSADSSELAAGIPAASRAEILVDYEKEIFLLLDGNLYKVASPLLQLAGNVGDWQFNPLDSSLIFSSNGELDYYNSFSHTINFITRSQNSITQPLLQLNLGEAFYFQGNRLSGIELDTRDHQNGYVFMDAQAPQKFQLDDENRTAVILDQGTLEIVKIR